MFFLFPGIKEVNQVRQMSLKSVQMPEQTFTKGKFWWVQILFFKLEWTLTIRDYKSDSVSDTVKHSLSNINFDSVSELKFDRDSFWSSIMEVLIWKLWRRCQVLLDVSTKIKNEPWTKPKRPFDEIFPTKGLESLRNLLKVLFCEGH